MINFPNAKINLGLYVTGKRPDNYHNLESVFYPIYDFYDVLEFIVSDCKDKILDISLSGLAVEGNPMENLCAKAFLMLKKDYDLPPVKIFLHKNIPTGSGLGGGSSDGAFMLKALNEYFKLSLDHKQLIEYASRLGSDCAFFIKNTPSFARGRGEILSNSKVNLKGYYGVLLNPKIHISTVEAYKNVPLDSPVINLEMLHEKPIQDWKSFLSNNFEKGIVEKYPLIQHLKESLYEFGAVYASMTGSGSSVFGIFNNEVEIPGQFIKYQAWKGWL